MATPSQVLAEVRRKDVVTRWLLSAPALSILCIAAVGPLFVMLLFSFLVKGEHGDVKYWQFSTEGWFSVFFQKDIFDDTVTIADAHLSILWRSVKLSLITTVLTLIIGFPTAYYISTQSAKRRDLLVFLVTIPFWTNILIRTFAIQQVINNEGIINTLLKWSGLTTSSIQIMYTDTAIFIGMLYVYLPLMVLPLYASMEKIDFRLVEAGYDLYATRFQVLRRVIIPLVKPGIVAGSILVFIPSLGAFVAPALLGGGKNLMLATLIDLQFGKGSNWPLGAALSITLLVIVTVALLFYVRNASKSGGAHGH
jgi:spermidine/putrescine transport system permease protein